MRLSIAILALTMAALGQAQSCPGGLSLTTACLGSVCLAPWGSNFFRSQAESVYEQICKTGLDSCPGGGTCGSTIGPAAICCNEQDWDLCFACFRDQICHDAEPTISFTVLSFMDPTGPVIIPKASCTFGQENNGGAIGTGAATSTSSTSSTPPPAQPPVTTPASSAPVSTPAATGSSSVGSSSTGSEGSATPAPTMSSSEGSAPTSSQNSEPSAMQATSTGAANGLVQAPRATAIGVLLAALGVGVL